MPSIYIYIGITLYPFLPTYLRISRQDQLGLWAPGRVVGDLVRPVCDAESDRITVLWQDETGGIDDILIVTGGGLRAVADGIDDADLSTGVVLPRTPG